MTLFTYRDFLAHAAQHISNNPNMRTGQAYLHVLQGMRPDLSSRIEEAQDPYYRDANLPLFLGFVRANW